MKKTVFLFICSFLTLGIYAQNLVGAWEGFHTSEENENLRSVLIFSENYQATAIYNADSGAFISTNGGTWKMNSNTMTQMVEFDSKNPHNVGKEFKFRLAQNDSVIEIVGSGLKMKKIDNGSPGKLSGAWLMSGRNLDGRTKLRDTNTPRKTMKILSGTRFQWIAYNTETKDFMATGGGSYTTQNGIYTETIEFFSRDSTRVGVQLKFDFSLTDGNWHHSGLSSKGDPIDEVWSKRN